MTPIIAHDGSGITAVRIPEQRVEPRRLVGRWPVEAGAGVFGRYRLEVLDPYDSGAIVLADPAEQRAADFTRLAGRGRGPCLQPIGGSVVKADVHAAIEIAPDITVHHARPHESVVDALV